MAIRAVLFDRDGTLIDFNPTWGVCSHHVIVGMAHNDPIGIERLAEIAKFDLATLTFAADSPILTGSINDYGPQWAAALDEPYNDAFSTRFGDLLLEGCALSVTAFPGVVDTIGGLFESGLPLGVATNGTEATAIRQLQAMEIFSCFSYVVGYDSGHGQKPGPGQVLAFAEMTGLPVSEIALVGDSLHDMHAARNAGAVPIAVTTGAHDEATLSAETEFVLDRLSDLPGLLRQLAAEAGI